MAGRPTSEDELVEVVRDAVPDGAVLAIGGTGLVRKPMALLRALVRADVRDLRVVSFLGSVDAELLLAAGVVAELHTAGVSLEGTGLAPRYRSVREGSEGAHVVPWSEGSLHTALTAATLGVPSMPATTSPRSDLVDANPWLRVVADPFTGQEVVQARSLRVQVAFLHVSAVDAAGNLHVDGDLGADDVLARAADRVVATTANVDHTRPATGAGIARVWVDDCHVVARGAWPTACLPDEPDDPQAVRAWARNRGEDVGLLLDAEVSA